MQNPAAWRDRRDGTPARQPRFLQGHFCAGRNRLGYQISAGPGSCLRLARREKGGRQLCSVRRGVRLWSRPGLRPDLVSRNPDLVNEAFRQYAITAGNLRVGRLFKELDVPLSIVLNAAFPGTYASVWKEFRAAQPKAPVIAHGMNNSNDILPLGRGLAEQKDYIRRTLELIASTTGVRPTGWSSPSVYSNADTMQAMAAAGITYNIDQMDSDTISRLRTPDGVLGLLPYPRSEEHTSELQSPVH